MATGSFDPTTFDSRDAAAWGGFKPHAATATQGIQNMPYVLNSATQHSMAGMTPEERHRTVYGSPQQGTGVSSLQSLLNLINSGGGNALLGGGAGGFGSGSLGTGSIMGGQIGNAAPVFGPDADWSFGGPILQANGLQRGVLTPADSQNVINAYNDPRQYHGWNAEMLGGPPIPGVMG